MMIAEDIGLHHRIPHRLAFLFVLSSFLVTLNLFHEASLFNFIEPTLFDYDESTAPFSPVNNSTESSAALLKKSNKYADTKQDTVKGTGKSAAPFIQMKNSAVRSPEALLKKSSMATVTKQDTTKDFQKSKTLLLMSDSRSLDIDDYHKLAYAINGHYAKLHGYRLRFVHTPCLESAPPAAKDKPKQCVACEHPKYGPRMSPWCKVKSVNDTMHLFKSSIDRIVYIDSDAFVNRLNATFKDRYFQKTLNMFANKGEKIPCSGIQFWQNTDTARAMIQAWWDSNTGVYNVQHDYEQSVFHTKSQLLKEYHNETGIIREPVREFSRISNGFFRHITNKKDGVRHERMEKFMQANGIDNAFRNLT